MKRTNQWIAKETRRDAWQDNKQDIWHATRQKVRRLDFTDITFTKTGWRQFCKLNTMLGARFIRGYILRKELAEYINAHEADGYQLDPECQQVRYEDGIYLGLKKMRGLWFITDVIATVEPVTFTPVCVWRRIKRGVTLIAEKVLCCWRSLRPTMRAGDIA